MIVRPAGLSFIKQLDFNFPFISQQIDLQMIELVNDTRLEKIHLIDGESDL